MHVAKVRWTLTSQSTLTLCNNHVSGFLSAFSSGETPNKFILLVRCHPWCLLPLNEWHGRWYNEICSQAEQAQLHGARMQTFIIEQQAFIIHTSGFPRSPKINYEPPLHTLRSLMLRHRRRWIFSCAPSLLTGAAFVNLFCEKETLYSRDKLRCGLCPVHAIGGSGLLRSQLKGLTPARDDFGDIDWLTAAERLEEESQHVQSVCAYFRLEIFHVVAPAARLKWTLNWFQLHV